MCDSGGAMNDRLQPVFPDLTDAGRKACPPVTPEVLAEIARRTQPDHLAEQERASRPGPEVVRDLLKKHAGPRSGAAAKTRACCTS
jgi:hypothetical protein